MLQLFQSIFGSGPSAPSVHSAELVERAIERAVEATDSRLRAVSGYKKTLRSAVTHALDHVVALVEGLPPVLDLDPRAFGTNPEVTVYFTSVDHVRDVLERDPTLSQWRSPVTLGERGELERERDLLRRKQAALAKGRWGFDSAGSEQPEVHT